VKQHVWLKDYNWQGLLDKKLKAPYVPDVNEDNFDAKQANGPDPWKEENAELLKQNALLLRRNSIQNLFSGYYYDVELLKMQKEDGDKKQNNNNNSSMNNSAIMNGPKSANTSGTATPQTPPEH
jgi:hypothetical protein